MKEPPAIESSPVPSTTVPLLDVAANHVIPDIPVGVGAVTPDGQFTDNKDVFDLNETVAIAITLNSHRRPNKSANSVYYNEKNAAVWVAVFEKVFNSQASEFIDGARVGLSGSTLSIRATYGLKWLCEKHPDVAERTKWMGVRQCISIKRVRTKSQQGILVVHKIQMMILHSVSGIAISGHDHLHAANAQDFVNAAIIDKKQRDESTRRRWQGLFFAWHQAAAVGDKFQYPACETDQNVALRQFDKGDEIWLLEISEAMPFEDYKFDWERNSVVVVR